VQEEENLHSLAWLGVYLYSEGCLSSW